MDRWEESMIPVWDLESSELEYIDPSVHDIEALSSMCEPIDLDGCGFNVLVRVGDRYMLMISVDYDDFIGDK
tara:strand:+ start:2618 stop:2833 length:216 start_codon:yes stop_codon:yes gene_type:complete